MNRIANPSCPDCGVEKFNGYVGKCALCSRARMEAQRKAYTKTEKYKAQQKTYRKWKRGVIRYKMVVIE